MATPSCYTHHILQRKVVLGMFGAAALVAGTALLATPTLQRAGFLAEADKKLDNTVEEEGFCCTSKSRRQHTCEGPMKPSECVTDRKGKFRGIGKDEAEVAKLQCSLDLCGGGCKEKMKTKELRNPETELLAPNECLPTPELYLSAPETVRHYYFKPESLSFNPAVHNAAMDSVGYLWCINDGGGLVLGSSFVFAPNVLITNAHVVNPCLKQDGKHFVSQTYFTVNGTRFPIAHENSIVAAKGEEGSTAQTNTDVAIVKLAGRLPTPALSLTPSPQNESIVHLVGTPDVMLKVHKITKSVSVGELLTTLAPSYIYTGEVRSGNSGGPLLDEDGHVVGIIWGEREDDGVVPEKKTANGSGKPLFSLFGTAVPGSVINEYLAKANLGPVRPPSTPQEPAPPSKPGAPVPPEKPAKPESPGTPKADETGTFCCNRSTQSCKAFPNVPPAQQAKYCVNLGQSNPTYSTKPFTSKNACEEFCASVLPPEYTSPRKPSLRDEASVRDGKLLGTPMERGEDGEETLFLPEEAQEFWGDDWEDQVHYPGGGGGPSGGGGGKTGGATGGGTTGGGGGGTTGGGTTGGGGTGDEMEEEREDEWEDENDTATTVGGDTDEGETEEEDAEDEPEPPLPLCDTPSGYWECNGTRAAIPTACRCAEARQCADFHSCLRCIEQSCNSTCSTDCAFHFTGGQWPCQCEGEHPHPPLPSSSSRSSHSSRSSASSLTFEQCTVGYRCTQTTLGGACQSLYPGDVCPGATSFFDLDCAGACGESACMGACCTCKAASASESSVSS